jgi:hypothetical protein
MAKQELGALARLYHLGVAKRSTSGGVTCARCYRVRH